MTLPASLLIVQLSSSLFAASYDETKKILNGSHFMLSFDSERNLKRLKTWTTDGHRMVLVQGMMESKSKATLTEPVSFTVPLKVLRELERQLNPTDKVTLYFEPSSTSDTGAGTVVFAWNNKRLVSATLEGQYPDCETAIKPFRDEYCRTVTIERLALLKTLERFAVLCDKSNKAMTVHLDSTCQEALLQIEHKDIGRGTETLNISMSGEDITLLYDVRYLLEVVKAIATSEIRIYLATPLTPSLIQPYGPADGVPLEAEYILAPLSGIDERS